MTKEQLAKLGIVIDENEIADEEALKLIEGRVGALNTDLTKNKNLLSQRNSEIAEFKRKEQDKLSEEEKTRLHYEELETTNKELTKRLAINDKVKGYMALGYNEELATKIANAEYEGKPTYEYHKEFINSREETIRAELLKGNPKPETKTPKTLTKSDFDKMGYEELMKLHEENPTLYNELANAK